MNKGNCPEGKIYNPKTKRCVLINGKIGQQILKELQQSKKTKEPKVPKQPKQEKQKKVDYNKDAKKVANKIKLMIKNKVKVNKFYVKDFNLDDNEIFDEDLVKLIGKTATLENSTMSYELNAYKLKIKDNKNHIIVTYFGDNDESDTDSTKFKVAIFGNKKKADEYYDNDEDDDE
jgi:hypothetical protein